MGDSQSHDARLVEKEQPTAPSAPLHQVHKRRRLEKDDSQSHDAVLMEEEPQQTDNRQLQANRSKREKKASKGLELYEWDNSLNRRIRLECKKELPFLINSK